MTPPSNPADLPAILIAYPFLDAFLADRQRWPGLYRNWCLDSGAFSVANSGAKIDRNKFADDAKRLLETDPTLTEVFALDVIGDHRRSLANAEYMWERGVPAIPTYHADEPVSYLKHIAKEYPKIAFGGVALRSTAKKIEWARQCFSHVWPKRVHGFAFSGKGSVMSLPFHSVDASNWKTAPLVWGRFLQFSARQDFGMGSHARVNGLRDTKTNVRALRSEIDEHLKLERLARGRWRKEMRLLGDEEAPTVRLSSSEMAILAGAYQVLEGDKR